MTYTFISTAKNYEHKYQNGDNNKICNVSTVALYIDEKLG